MLNFILFDVKTKDGYCCVLEEVHKDPSNEVFAFLQYSHFSYFLKDNPTIKELIIWSDGCGYQNRNTAIFSAYLELFR